MNDVFKWFSDGGPVMWPILVLSVVGLALVVERLLAFRTFARETGPFDDPQGRLNRLQRGFGFLSTIITAEPMLGILGTVTGIMQTFGALNGADGVVNPMSATAGIGEALITTAAGLVASLVLLFPYNLLDARIEDDEKK